MTVCKPINNTIFPSNLKTLNSRIKRKQENSIKILCSEKNLYWNFHTGPKIGSLYNFYTKLPSLINKLRLTSEYIVDAVQRVAWPGFV